MPGHSTISRSPEKDASKASRPETPRQDLPAVPARAQRSEIGAVLRAPAAPRKAAIPWKRGSVERFAGGKSGRSEEYKEILRSLDAYHALSAPRAEEEIAAAERVASAALKWKQKHAPWQTSKHWDRWFQERREQRWKVIDQVQKDAEEAKRSLAPVATPEKTAEAFEDSSLLDSPSRTQAPPELTTDAAPLVNPEKQEVEHSSEEETLAPPQSQDMPSTEGFSHLMRSLEQVKVGEKNIPQRDFITVFSELNERVKNWQKADQEPWLSFYRAYADKIVWFAKRMGEEKLCTDPFQIIPNDRDALEALMSGATESTLKELVGTWTAPAAEQSAPKRRESITREALASMKALWLEDQKARQELSKEYLSRWDEIMPQLFRNKGNERPPKDNPYFRFGEGHKAVSPLLLGKNPTVDVGLLPFKDAAFRALFVENFGKQYGGYACLKALYAFRAEGLPDEWLGGLWEYVIHDVKSRNTSAIARLHGNSTTQKLVDYSAQIGRFITMRSGRAISFAPIESGAQDPPRAPELNPTIDPSTIPTASLEDILTLAPQQKALEPTDFKANGRTIRYQDPKTKTVRAVKFMKSTESPGKLLHEHASFALMQRALADYPAKPAFIPLKSEQHGLLRIPEENLPAGVKEALTAESKKGGFEVKPLDGFYPVMAYDVTAERLEDPNMFFEYLEETRDDAAFVKGFKSSMGTLGAMAAKGFFDPNLIMNAYHDPKYGRGFVWSPGYLREAPNTGSEKAALSNARWSNFRTGGLADPDELRGIDQLVGEELARLVGDKHIAEQVESLEKKGKLSRNILTGYLIGRMLHESLVIATRRLVLQADYPNDAASANRTGLETAFKKAVKEGILAFAKAFTGAEPERFMKELKANGLDLDHAIEGMLLERRALYSYDYTRWIREQNTGALRELFGGAEFEFEASEEDLYRSAKLHRDRNQVLQDQDPLESVKKNLPLGWVTLVFLDQGGKATGIEDLGWMASLDDLPEQQLKDIFGSPGVLWIEREVQEGQGITIAITAAEPFDRRRYIADMRRQLNEKQDVGAFNGLYFFLNELRSNHIISSTLVDMRASRKLNDAT